MRFVFASTSLLLLLLPLACDKPAAPPESQAIGESVTTCALQCSQDGNARLDYSCYQACEPCIQWQYYADKMPGQELEGFGCVDACILDGSHVDPVCDEACTKCRAFSEGTPLPADNPPPAPAPPPAD